MDLRWSLAGPHCSEFALCPLTVKGTKINSTAHSGYPQWGPIPWYASLTVKTVVSQIDPMSLHSIWRIEAAVQNKGSSGFCAEWGPNAELKPFLFNIFYFPTTVLGLSVWDRKESQHEAAKIPPFFPPPPPNLPSSNLFVFFVLILCSLNLRK